MFASNRRGKSHRIWDIRYASSAISFSIALICIAYRAPFIKKKNTDCKRRLALNKKKYACVSPWIEADQLASVRWCVDRQDSVDRGCCVLRNEANAEPCDVSRPRRPVRAYMEAAGRLKLALPRRSCSFVRIVSTLGVVKKQHKERSW